MRGTGIMLHTGQKFLAAPERPWRGRIEVHGPKEAM